MRNTVIMAMLDSHDNLCDPADDLLFFKVYLVTFLILLLHLLLDLTLYVAVFSMVHDDAQLSSMLILKGLLQIDNIPMTDCLQVPYFAHYTGFLLLI